MSPRWLPILLVFSAALGAGAEEPLLVVDGAGRTVKVPRRPARIVSLAPSVTEMLFALGAGDRVVGVTDFCTYPPEAASRTHIGGLINPDLERIVSLHPDLAIATTTGNYRDDAERIERLGVPVYTIATPTLEATLAALERLGDLVGAAPAARGLTADLRGRIEAVRRAAAGRPRPRVLFVIEPDPLIAAGGGSFIGEALAIAGASPVPQGGGPAWAQVDLEQVLGMDPEVILTAEANRSWADGLAGRAEWRKLPAVQAGRVYVVSDAIQHPGPRLVDGIEEMGRILEGAFGEGARSYRRSALSALPSAAPPPMDPSDQGCVRNIPEVGVATTRIRAGTSLGRAWDVPFGGEAPACRRLTCTCEAARRPLPGS